MTIGEGDKELLRQCAANGPTDLQSPGLERLERGGLIRFDFDGRLLQGRWRVTDRGREVLATYHDEAPRWGR